MSGKRIHHDPLPDESEIPMVNFFDLTDEELKVLNPYDFDKAINRLKNLKIEDTDELQYFQKKEWSFKNYFCDIDSDNNEIDNDRCIEMQSKVKDKNEEEEKIIGRRQLSQILYSKKISTLDIQLIFNNIKEDLFKYIDYCDFSEISDEIDIDIDYNIKLINNFIEEVRDNFI